MRKNLFITIDFPPQLGGVATYISHVCKYIPQDKIIVLAHSDDEKEHEVDPVSRKGFRSWQEFDKKQSYPILRKNFYPKWYKLLFYIHKFVKKHKIEVIHNSHVLPLGYVTLILKKITKTPYIIYLHGYDLRLAKKNNWKKFWLKIILNNAEHIIVNSEFTKQELLTVKDYSDKTKIIYPCPRDILHEIKPLDDITNKYQNKQILLTIGRLVPRKGHDKVLEVIPKLKEKYTNLKYIIIGDGPQKQFLQNMVKTLKIEENVDILGAQDTEVLPSYLSICDIFILPNRQVNEDVEGFGIVFLSAGLFGKPCIGGNNGGAVEAIEHGKSGLLINPENTDEIYAVIDKLLSNPDLAKALGEYGKIRVNTEFTWEKQIHKLKELITKNEME